MTERKIFARAFFVGCLGVVIPSAFAAGPDGLPSHEGTVKAAVGIPRELFSRQQVLIDERRGKWLKDAELSMPRLVERRVKAVGLVKPKNDSRAFLGWRFEKAGALDDVFGKPLSPGDVFYFDFGEHLTGYFSFRLGRGDVPVDAPPRLRFEFGEVPAEILLPFGQGRGISRSWHQDETVTVDVVPSQTEISRRLAFRYVKVTVEACSVNGRFSLDDVEVRAVTSADESKLLAYEGEPGDVSLDRVSNRTLRECMQTVLEDGPKRDRRLWLGDLRLQALVNYLTYRNYDVVKRSMLILAGTCGTNGLVTTAAYEKPLPERSDSRILDYTALYANVVLEYLEASGDRSTCESLWPLVLKQADFTLETVDETGLIREELPWWQFIDWQPALKRQASEQAVIVVGLRALERLAVALGHEDEVSFVPLVIDRMKGAARKNLWDEKRGVWVSCRDNVSWMSQAWMALARISTLEQARRSLKAVMADPSAVKPVTPYAHHYFTEALFCCGLRDEAFAHLRNYWGGMLALGADTYWEVWVPEDHWKAPYENVALNSFCHAFSCTSGYLLRKYAGEEHGCEERIWRDE